MQEYAGSGGFYAGKNGYICSFCRPSRL